MKTIWRSPTLSLILSLTTILLCCPAFAQAPSQYEEMATAKAEGGAHRLEQILPYLFMGANHVKIKQPGDVPNATTLGEALDAMRVQGGRLLKDGGSCGNRIAPSYNMGCSFTVVTPSCKGWIVSVDYNTYCADDNTSETCVNPIVQDAEVHKVGEIEFFGYLGSYHDGGQWVRSHQDCSEIPTELISIPTAVQMNGDPNPPKLLARNFFDPNSSDETSMAREQALAAALPATTASSAVGEDPAANTCVHRAAQLAVPYDVVYQVSGIYLPGIVVNSPFCRIVVAADSKVLRSSFGSTPGGRELFEIIKSSPRDFDDYTVGCAQVDEKGVWHINPFALVEFKDTDAPSLGNCPTPPQNTDYIGRPVPHTTSEWN